MGVPLMSESVCPGCQVTLPLMEGAVHRYMTSTAACWNRYGELLAREYGDPEYMAVHRFTVDAYAAQHPGEPSPQAIQSVAVHLTALCAALEQGWPLSRLPRLLKNMADNGEFHWLEPPRHPGDFTVLHPLSATNATEHKTYVKQWAESVWGSWHEHHPQVHSWLKTFS